MSQKGRENIRNSEEIDQNRLMRSLESNWNDLSSLEAELICEAFCTFGDCVKKPEIKFMHSMFRKVVCTVRMFTELKETTWKIILISYCTLNDELGDAYQDKIDGPIHCQIPKFVKLEMIRYIRWSSKHSLFGTQCTYREGIYKLG